MIATARPVGPLKLTPALKILIALAAAGGLVMIWRFIFGIGATTALNDGYPWGLWIAYDVVTGTALACGGYAVALLVYALNKGEYHPLIRPALVTSALGYSMAGFSVVLDVGRPWLMWKVPLFFGSWNLNSALLEVALCIMAYVIVVWIELTPAVIDRVTADGPNRWRALAARARPLVDRGLTWIIALALLLPTMHQSSLGTLMVVSGPRLHPLWQTPLLPLLFLTSCLAMGFAAVVFETVLSHTLLKRPIETAMLAKLAKYVVPLQGAFVALRLADLAFRGSLGAAFALDGYALIFWGEMALFVAPAVMLMSSRTMTDIGALFRTAMLLIVAGAVYRFDTFLVAFRPGNHYSYFPSVGEIAVTTGIVSAEILAYVVLIHYFPIISGGGTRAAERAGV
jgi:Ni/Fe-hydrogenase subunit HybB-like protein